MKFNSQCKSRWYWFDGKHTYPVNEDGTLCMCLHDEKQKCSCVCHEGVFT